jgi:BirA family biotin operon repressor/biotin-[acetyl-CoA-carboxylase] ligase
VSALLGHPRLHLKATDSTNDRARELAIAGAPHGALVTASEQSAGRGRQGRIWAAPSDTALLMSLILRDPPALLPLIAGVAVCDVIGPGMAIKWPNDIVVPGTLAKLGGILVEGRPQEGWAVLGIGLNVAVHVEELPADVRAKAASLELGSDRIEPLLDLLLGALAQRLAEPANGVLAAWRAKDVLLGRELSWAEGQGVAQGVDERGHLTVRRADGTLTTLSAGEVHLASVG